MKIMANLTTVGLLVLLFACTKQTQVSEIKLLSYGVAQGEAVETVKDPTAVAGSVDILDEWRVTKQTTDIRSRPGIRFGIEYSLHGQPSERQVVVEEVIIFPDDGLTNPDTGVTQKRYGSESLVLLNQPTFFAYGLDEPWEEKPGQWIFRVKYVDRIVIEVTFNLS